MNSAAYVDQEITRIKASGKPVSDAAWEAARLCEGWPYTFGDRGQYCTPAHREAVYKSHPDQTGLITKCLVLRNGAASCAGCKWYPDGKRVRSFDCRGFTYWILLQICGWKLMGAGATSQWNNEDNWTAKGEISEIPDDVLVCVFYREKNDKSKMAHTGFAYHGQTIECGNGVVYSKTINKKWQYWAIPKCISDTVPEPDPDKKPTLRKGDSGSYVTLAQTELIQKGYDLGKWGADGKFGDATEKAVKAFQHNAELEADGIIDQATWDALDSTEPAKMYTVIVPNLTLTQAEAIIATYPGATKTDGG